MKKYHRALTIAGSDSGGGAGIQADLKTFSALGCFGMSAITALTAQNTHSVTAIHPAPPEFLKAQLDAVLSDIGTDAVKIGMLHSPEVIGVVADALAEWKCGNVVLDPVMISKSGDKLLQDEAVSALKERLLSLATVITPNLPEASVLLGREVEKKEEMLAAAKDLSKLGCSAVLLKGGHLTGDESGDLLYSAQEDSYFWFPEKRIPTENSHGTGCTLSSAICAGLAKGLDLQKAVEGAKTYITDALAAGSDYKTGQGHGPVHHFHEFWR